ncbi:MAG: hypothetical protein DHS20C16_21280 [Phycisphaerae bacterium]|nr:MAG: hypothetical protein DHS20C16_21280 [Phycisphaerae bacterium]
MGDDGRAANQSLPILLRRIVNEAQARIVIQLEGAAQDLAQFGGLICDPLNERTDQLIKRFRLG